MKLSKKQFALIIIIPLTILAGGWIYFFLNKSGGIMATKLEYPFAMERNLLLPSLVFFISVPVFYLVFYSRKFATILVYVLCALAILHQYYSYTKNMYFSERSFVYPEHELFTYLQNTNNSFSRVVGFGKAAIKPNVSSYFGISSPEGLDPMLPKRYAALAWDTYAIQSGRTTNPVIEVGFGDLFSEESIITGDEPIFSFFNIAGVRYIVTHDDDKYVIGGDKLKKLTTIPPFVVWEFESLPRAFTTTDYQVGDDFDDLYSNTLILGKDPNVDSRCPTVPANIIYYTSNNVSLETNSDCEAILYLSDTFYPGWKATIDGSEEEVLVANYAFRALKIPSGNHVVTMRYDPLSIRIGYYISLVTAMSLMGWAIYAYVKKI